MPSKRKIYDGVVEVEIEALDEFQAEALLAQLMGCPGVTVKSRYIHKPFEKGNENHDS